MYCRLPLLELNIQLQLDNIVYIGGVDVLQVAIASTKYTIIVDNIVYIGGVDVLQVAIASTKYTIIVR